MPNRIEPNDERVRIGRGERADDDQAVETIEQDDDDELDELTTRQEELLDEGVEETFPASDPISPA